MSEPKYKIGDIVKVQALPGLEKGVLWGRIHYIKQDETKIWYKLDGLDFERREEDILLDKEEIE